MEFDKTRFVADAAEAHMGAPDRPLEALLDAIGNEIAALHAEIAALKAMTTPEPQRETVYVVKTSGMNLAVSVGLGGTLGTVPLRVENKRTILWFDECQDAQDLCRLLGIGEPLLVYKDTLEEVAHDA